MNTNRALRTYLYYGSTHSESMNCIGDLSILTVFMSTSLPCCSSFPETGIAHVSLRKPVQSGVLFTSTDSELKPRE